MNAICKSSEGLQLTQVPRPEKVPPAHLFIRMSYATISHGDKAFINRQAPPGAVNSLYDVYGSSGAGEVLELGTGVPEKYMGKKVTIYRSLHTSNDIVGCWSEYAIMHYMDCVIIPDDAAAAEYSGSLGNIITSYAFRMLAAADGHTGIITTAGTSATGITLLGLANVLQFPLISLVRNEEKKRELMALGATHVLVQDAPDFKEQLKETAARLKTTAVFDGIGGSSINAIIDSIPPYSTIYSYGFMGDAPLNVYMRQFLFNGLSIKPYSVMATDTVRDTKQLSKAFEVIEKYIHLPHFKTKVGKVFALAELNEALNYASADNSKAVFRCTLDH